MSVTDGEDCLAVWKRVGISGVVEPLRRPVLQMVKTAYGRWLSAFLNPAKFAHKKRTPSDSPTRVLLWDDNQLQIVMRNGVCNATPAPGPGQPGAPSPNSLARPAATPVRAG